MILKLRTKKIVNLQERSIRSQLVYNALDPDPPAAPVVVESAKFLFDTYEGVWVIWLIENIQVALSNA